MERQKIAYIVGADPNDRRSWSGTYYSILQQLKRFFDVEVLLIQYTPTKRESLAMRLRCKFHSWIKKETGPANNYYVKSIGRQVSALLAKGHYDAAVMLGMEFGAYVKTDVPLVYYSDATWHLMIDYYLFNYSRSAIAIGNRIQRRTMENSSVCMLASDWARNDAINSYHIPADKCVVGHLGANVDTEQFQRLKHDKTVVNLLFTGANWKRKGGAIAVQCVRLLNQHSDGKRYILHIAGSQPTEEITDDFIKVYGFLNRNIPEQREQMIQLREMADIFILPTRAECAGIVFCEASAYGIPSVTYDTGGIGSYIINGENGYRLPMSATAVDFADTIESLVNDGDKLETMRLKARQMYKDKLNWNALGEQLKETIQNLTMK